MGDVIEPSATRIHDLRGVGLLFKKIAQKMDKIFGKCIMFQFKRKQEKIIVFFSNSLIK